MFLTDNKGAGEIELGGGVYNEYPCAEAIQIERILNRAHEIHRAHGGLFGYDLEDWLQAERESFERNELFNFQFEETTNTQPLLLDQERDFQECFGLNN